MFNLSTSTLYKIREIKQVPAAILDKNVYVMVRDTQDTVDLELVFAFALQNQSFLMDG